MIDFLNSFINRNENIEDLLKLINQTFNCQTSCIFLNTDNINYKRISYFDVKGIKIYPTYEPLKHLDDIFVLNNVKNINNINGFSWKNTISNISIIPVNINNIKLGIICLLNKKKSFDEKFIIDITPYISIVQLILNKHKILQDCQNIENINLTGQTRELFLANISHEIRTPLNGIIGYGQLLGQTSLTSVQKGYLTSMNHCGIQLMKIINDLLDFSRLSCGKMTKNNDCFDIQEIINIVKDTMKQKILEKKQKLVIFPDQNVSKYIITDKQKLIQIIVNLLSNANKFSDIETVIEVGINFIEKEDYLLEIYIKDNGIGISEENQYKLFNSFVQINNTEMKTGTGLGLYICKKLIELLGGDINIKSSVSKGSTFTFNIKYEPYTDFEKKLKIDSLLIKNKYILVVDDNADNRILLSEILFEWEMKPIICASALEALRMIMSKRYNFYLGLIDICMPGISGTDLAKQIKEENLFFPMIALSSIDSFVNSVEFECKLDKPINKIQLFNAIYDVLIKIKNPTGFIGYKDSDNKLKNDYNINTKRNNKILIAEDVLYNATMLLNMLENLKFKNINIANNGKEAIKMLETDYNNNVPYDILLLDLLMPHMNGYDVINFINDKKWNIKIIVITASVSQDEVIKCRNMGIKYFINKPIDLKQLKEILIHC